MRPQRPAPGLAAADAEIGARARILAATEELLSREEVGEFRLSVDAIARRAELSRTAVYDHFNSRTDVLEGLIDVLASRSQADQVLRGGSEAEPREALLGHIGSVGRLWGSSRAMFRRLHALAALDRKVGQALSARYEVRRRWLREIIGRLDQVTGGRPPPVARDDIISIIFTLTSFESFDSLAGSGNIEDAIPLVQRLVVGLEPIWWGL